MVGHHEGRDDEDNEEDSQGNLATLATRLLIAGRGVHTIHNGVNDLVEVPIGFLAVRSGDKQSTSFSSRQIRVSSTGERGSRNASEVLVNPGVALGDTLFQVVSVDLSEGRSYE